VRDLTPFAFQPEYQPDESPAEFTLRPLDLPQYFTVQMAYGQGAVNWEVVSGIASRNVLGWTGTEPTYSRGALRDILTAGDNKWALWLLQITAELFRRAQLTETERKN
jgi:hypothetical protein